MLGFWMLAGAGGQESSPDLLASHLVNLVWPKFLRVSKATLSCVIFLMVQPG